MPTEGLNTSELSQSTVGGFTLGAAPAGSELLAGTASALSSNLMQEVRSTPAIVAPFGTYSNPTTNYTQVGGQNTSSILYPNDVVTLDIYNNNDQYLETNFRVSSFLKTGNNLRLDPETDLSGSGYISGKYKFNITSIGIY